MKKNLIIYENQQLYNNNDSIIKEKIKKLSLQENMKLPFIKIYI